MIPTRRVPLTLLVTVGLALALTPLSISTYRSWRGTDEPTVIICHWIAIATHFVSAILPDSSTGGITFLCAGAAWDTKIHILTSALRRTMYINNSPLFALMDLTHSVALAWLLLGRFGSRNPIVLLAVCVGLFEHVSGFLGTCLGVASVRETILYLCPEGIDAVTTVDSAAPPLVFSLFFAWLPASMLPLTREVLFQSDVVSSVFLQLCLAAHLLYVTPTAGDIIKSSTWCAFKFERGFRDIVSAANSPLCAPLGKVKVSPAATRPNSRRVILVNYEQGTTTCRGFACSAV